MFLGQRRASPPAKRSRLLDAALYRYATGVRGACHTNDVSYSVGTGILDWPDIGLGAGTVDVKQNEGAAAAVKHCQDLWQIVGSAALCYMTILALDGEDVAELMSAASGFDYSFEELVECGERIWHTKRGLSNLMGIEAEDDRLPRQILTPPTDGGARGSGAQPGNTNARKHGFYAAAAKAERRALRARIRGWAKQVREVG